MEDEMRSEQEEGKRQNREESLLDKVFDDPSPPAPALITQEILEDDLPFTADPASMVQSYLQQNLLAEALAVYRAGLSASQPMKVRMQAANKVTALALEDKGDRGKNLSINFSFGGKFNERPEIEVGESIETGEGQRFGKK